MHAAANHGEYPDFKSKGMNTFCYTENSLPRFYAAQTAASKSNVEQAAAAPVQPASPASIERQKYLKDKGFRVRFSEKISYRSPSPSKYEDEDDDVEEIGRGQRLPEEVFLSDEDDITEYIAWSNCIKNKYAHASPGTFDYFRVQTAGTVPTVGSSVSEPGVKDPYDHDWAKKLNLPAREHGSIGRIDYSKVQKAGVRGFFTLDGADDPNDHEWAVSRRQHGRSITIDYPRVQPAFTTLTAGRSCSLDGGRDPFDLGWAQKLHLWPRRQQEQDRGTSEYYIVPEPNQAVNGEQSRRYDPAHMEHLQHTSEYHRAITDVHHTTQRRLEQPQPQVQQSQQQPVWSRPSVRSPFNFFRRDHHSKDCYDAPDVVRSPVEGPIQGHGHGPVHGPAQHPAQHPNERPVQSPRHGPSHGPSQGRGDHRRQFDQPARPANIPSSFRGAVLSPDDLARARSRYREHTLPPQPYVNNPGPPQFVSPGSQPIDTTMRYRNAPMMNVRSLGFIDKASLGPQYQTPAAGPGQQPAYPPAAFNQYPNPNAGPAQHHGIPAPTQYYQPPATGPRPYNQAAGPAQYLATYGYPYNSGPVPYSGVPVPAQFYHGASHGAYAPAGPMWNRPGAAATAPQMYGQTRANQANFGAPPRTFVQTTPAQRHPSAVFPGQIRQDAPVEHYNSEGFEGAFAQTTPSQHHPPAAIPGAPAHAGPGPTQYISNAGGAFSQGIPAGPIQYRQAHAAAPVAPGQHRHQHQHQNRPAAATPGGLTRAATQKALPPTPTSQQSSSSHVPLSTSQTPLSATRHTPTVPSNQMSHSVHRRSATTAPSSGHGQGHGHGHGHPHRHSSAPRPTSVGPNAQQPHFFRPDFTTIDPVTVQGHGRDVMMRDARFFVNRDRDVSLHNMVSDRTVATTGQNPSSSTSTTPTTAASSSHEDTSVRPRGADSRDRWAEQNLDKQEEDHIANAMRQPAQKNNDKGEI